MVDEEFVADPVEGIGRDAGLGMASHLLDGLGGQPGGPADLLDGFGGLHLRAGEGGRGLAADVFRAGDSGRDGEPGTDHAALERSNGCGARIVGHTLDLIGGRVQS